MAIDPLITNEHEIPSSVSYGLVPGQNRLSNGGTTPPREIIRPLKIHDLPRDGFRDVYDERRKVGVHLREMDLPYLARLDSFEPLKGSRHYNRSA